MLLREARQVVYLAGRSDVRGEAMMELVPIRAWRSVVAWPWMQQSIARQSWLKLLQLLVFVYFSVLDTARCAAACNTLLALNSLCV